MPLGRQRQQPPEHPGIPDPAALDQSIEIQPVAHDLLEDLQVEGGVVGDQDTVPVGLEEGGDGVAREEEPAPVVGGRREDQRRDDLRVLVVDQQGLGVDGEQAVEDASLVGRPFLERAIMRSQTALDDHG